LMSWHIVRSVFTSMNGMFILSTFTDIADSVKHINLYDKL